MNKEELIRKIKALAERGEGGEKENAQRLLVDLMAKYDIKEEDISKDSIKEFDFKVPKFYKAGDLVNQVLYSVIGKELGIDKGVYKWRGTKSFFIRCTTAEFLEFEAKFKFYSHYFKKEIDRFYSAFIQANNIFPPDNKKRENNQNYELSEEDIAMLKLSRNLETHKYNLQIEGGNNG